MCLIAAYSPQEIVGLLWVIVQVALGLGAVIFVHELGHFAVAKMCGVMCHKFFVGFDIGGYKLSRKIGETEYGIGILPLGGYVKMLGQDDNPANIAEQVRESQVSGDSAGKIETKEIVGPDGETYQVDKRSYLAKSVPQRMAIISAGVVMNVIFAFIFAAVAFGIGVPYQPCIVSKAAPGSPAWQAGIRTGDEIVRIGDKKDPSFLDLQGGVMLGDLENGIEFGVRKAGQESIEDVTLRPRQDGGPARVGIASYSSLRLVKEQPFRPGSAASLATPALEGSDEIIAANGEPISEYSQLAAALASGPDKPLTIVVRRGGEANENDPFGSRTGGEEIEVTIPPQPMRRLGLVMETGKVVAVEDGTPASEVLRPGDIIDRVQSAEETPDAELTGQDWSFADPITLPEELRQLAAEGRDARLTVRRSGTGAEGRQETEELPISLRDVTWLESAISPGDPLSAPALGVAYRVLNRVDGVRAGAAADAGLQKGDIIVQAKLLLPDDMPNKPKKNDPLVFTDEGKSKNKSDWPAFISLLQQLPAETRVELTYKRGDETKTVELMPTASEEFFTAERGLYLQAAQRMRVADTLGEQLSLGYDQTVDSLGLVYRFLGKLGTQVPITSLGGPITIARAAGASASDGLGKLLVFLTMLSANLAVINFLPIPLLDGGHMVFLLWEGLRGRPASEKLVVALHTVGFVFIITLMLFVISLDLELIPRSL